MFIRHLPFFIPDTCKRLLWQTVKTQVKKWSALFVKIKRTEMHHYLGISFCDQDKMCNSILILSTCMETPSECITYYNVGQCAEND